MRRVYYVLAPVPLLWFALAMQSLHNTDQTTRAWTGGAMILPPLLLSFLLFWLGVLGTGVMWRQNKPVGWMAFSTFMAGGVCYYAIFRVLTNAG
jgi:hypothetical protein